MKRICIFPKDVSLLLGISLRDAQRLIRNIRNAKNKKKYQYITIREFAHYTGIDEDLIDL